MIDDFENIYSATYEDIQIKVDNWGDNTIWLDDVNLSSSDTSEQVTFLYPDHLGRPVSANFDYLPFGAVYQGTPETNLRFPGQYQDRVDLYQNGFRDYNPKLGMYMEPDPFRGLREIPQTFNLYPYVMNNPFYLTDPYGLLTTYYGGGATAYYGNAGNATASAGAILYSNKTGWLGGNFVSYGAEKAPLGDIETTLGAGAGAGSVFGFMTGSADAFKGKARNLTLDLYFLGVTYTTNGSEWGLSVGFGGKGVGFGYYMNETNTIISGEKSNPCK